MLGTAIGAMLDLMAAGGAIGDNLSLPVGLAYSGKERQLSHLH